jgi:phosphatidylglycerophosphate synthase
MTPIRRNTGFLAAAEARALDRMVLRVPGWVTPDMLSALGLAGALAAGLGFALVLLHPGFWGLAILGIGLNWAGDSLDGRLARLRGTSRPCRGYLLDNGLDMIGFLAVAAGFAASGLLWPALPFLAVALHFMLVNLAAARLAVSGVLDLSAGAIGTTELRAIFAGGAACCAFVPAESLAASHAWVAVGEWVLRATPLEIGCGVWVVGMAVAVVTTLRADVRMGAERDARTPVAATQTPAPDVPGPAARPAPAAPRLVALHARARRAGRPAGRSP